MIIFAFKKAELKKKIQDAYFSLPIKNPNLLLKNRFRIRIPKLAKNLADPGFRYGLPTLVITCSSILNIEKSTFFLACLNIFMILKIVFSKI